MQRTTDMQTAFEAEQGNPPRGPTPVAKCVARESERLAECEREGEQEGRG